MNACLQQYWWLLAMGTVVPTLLAWAFCAWFLSPTQVFRREMREVEHQVEMNVKELQQEQTDDHDG